MESIVLISGQLAPERIAFVKFIIEAYDGLATLSTVDGSTGQILLRCAQSGVAELSVLLGVLGVKISTHT